MKVLVKQLVAVVAMFLMSISSSWAQWELDSDRSAINFISIKNSSIAESHSFASMVGFIGKDGKVQLVVDLDSVKTLIDIRNERMRAVLFETEKFPAANITAQIDASVLAAVAEGATVSLETPIELSLHGVTKTITTSLIAVSEDDGPVRVFTARPIVINAADFALSGGVAALQEIAGLKAISLAVPVTLHLLFKPAA